MRVKALTLHQPWASLIAMGVKTIETRSWATKYRGPLAIHAGAERPSMVHLPPLHSHGSGGRDWCRSQPDCWHWLVCDTITDPAFHGPLPQGKRVPKRAQTPTLFFPARGPHGRPHTPGTPATEQETAVYIPLGTIVATCELVDVVPIVDGACGPGHAVLQVHGDCLLGDDPFGDPRVHRDFTDQLPYGDFTPGRFAWLLDDIRPLDPPVPCKGRQKLWNVPDGVLEGVRP